jgi:hypothetical protein
LNKQNRLEILYVACKFQTVILWKVVSSMARVTFDSVFTKKRDGSLTPKQRIRVGGVELGPGVSFRKGVAFGGVDFTEFIQRDLEVETDGQIVVIKGIYK